MQTKQPPSKAGEFELRAESPDTRRLCDASYADFAIYSPLPFVGEGADAALITGPGFPLR